MMERTSRLVLMTILLLGPGCPSPAGADLPLYEEVYLRQKPPKPDEPANWTLEHILSDEVENPSEEVPVMLPPRSSGQGWRGFLLHTDSASVGHSSKGRLRRGRKLPKKGTGFIRKNDKAPWGTDETVAILLWACQKMTVLYPGTVPMVVGDLSAERGGRLKPHASHQSGRDIDVGYYFKNNMRLRHFKDATPGNMDVDKTWSFIHLLLSTGKVQYLFIDRSLHRTLYTHALSVGWSEQELKKLFEAPVGLGAKRGIIRHIKGHVHHIHIRFHCPKGDRECR